MLIEKSTSLASQSTWNIFWKINIYWPFNADPLLLVYHSPIETSPGLLENPHLLEYSLQIAHLLGSQFCDQYIYSLGNNIFWPPKFPGLFLEKFTFIGLSQSFEYSLKNPTVLAKHNPWNAWLLASQNPWNIF